MITLKKATIDDFDCFYNIKCEQNNIYWSGHSEKPDFDKLKNWFYNKLNSKNREILIIKYNNICCGYIYVDLIEDNKIEISYGVKEKFSRKGIATSSIQKVIAYLDKYENKEIFCYVADQNIPSIKVVTKNNFKKTDDCKLVTFNQIDEQVNMRKYIYEK